IQVAWPNCRFVPTLLDAVLRGSPLEGLTEPGAARGDELCVDVRLGSSGPFRHDKRMVTLSNHMHRYRHDQLLQCPAQQLKGTQGITGARKEQQRHGDVGQVLSAELLWFSGRMERAAEQHYASDRVPLGRQLRRDAPAQRLP